MSFCDIVFQQKINQIYWEISHHSAPELLQVLISSVLMKERNSGTQQYSVVLKTDTTDTALFQSFT